MMNERISNVVQFLVVDVWRWSDADARVELERIVGGDPSVAKAALRSLSSSAYWARSPREDFLKDFHEDYRYDRARRLLESVIADGPLAPQPSGLLSLFESDQSADQLVNRAVDLVAENDSDESIMTQLGGYGLTPPILERIAVRADSLSEEAAISGRARRLLRHLAGIAVSEEAGEMVPGLRE